MDDKKRKINDIYAGHRQIQTKEPDFRHCAHTQRRLPKSASIQGANTVPATLLFAKTKSIQILKVKVSTEAVHNSVDVALVNAPKPDTTYSALACSIHGHPIGSAGKFDRREFNMLPLTRKFSSAPIQGYPA